METNEEVMISRCIAFVQWVDIVIIAIQSNTLYLTYLQRCKTQTSWTNALSTTKMTIVVVWKKLPSRSSPPRPRRHFGSRQTFGGRISCTSRVRLAQCQLSKPLAIFSRLMPNSPSSIKLLQVRDGSSALPTSIQETTKPTSKQDLPPATISSLLYGGLPFYPSMFRSCVWDWRFIPSCHWLRYRRRVVELRLGSILHGLLLNSQR